MRWESVLVLTLIAAAACALIALFGIWRKDRRLREQARFDLLREALRHPQLDEATRVELLRRVAGGHRLDLPKLGAVLRTLWFSTGWLLFVGASGFLFLAFVDVIDIWQVEPVAATAVTGFAMLTLPLGLRELNRRERIAADG